MMYIIQTYSFNKVIFRVPLNKCIFRYQSRERSIGRCTRKITLNVLYRCVFKLLHQIHFCMQTGIFLKVFKLTVMPLNQAIVFSYRNCSPALNENIKLTNPMLSIGQSPHIKWIKPKHLKNLDVMNGQHKVIF